MPRAIGYGNCDPGRWPMRCGNGCLAAATACPTGSATAKAIDYSLKRWTALTRFIDDGAVPIDNNWVENQIRPIALGRSNWLFAAHCEAGKRAAAAMSLMHSAKLNGHDPYHYLKDVLVGCPRSRPAGSRNCCRIAGSPTHWPPRCTPYWPSDPYAGHVFAFRGRRGDLIKLLWSDGDGMCLLTKRLERGRFMWPQADSGSVMLSVAQLSMLLEGIDWRRPSAPGSHALRPEFGCKRGAITLTVHAPLYGGGAWAQSRSMTLDEALQRNAELGARVQRSRRRTQARAARPSTSSSSRSPTCGA
jgi:hypothetical protein